jgi:hypothetical protein
MGLQNISIVYMQPVVPDSLVRDSHGCDFRVFVARDVMPCSVAVRYRAYLMSLFAQSLNTCVVLCRWTQ